MATRGREAGQPSTEVLPGRRQDSDRVRRFRLLVLEGPQQGVLWSSTGDRCSIGSHMSNDLVLEDPSVSAFHCEIAVDSKGARIRDLETTNGTVVDGVEIYAAALRGASVVKIGRSVVQFEFEKAHHSLPVSDRRQYGDLVADSVAMRCLFTLLERAARSDATVLLQGETGTGKEAAARTLHDESERAEHPFVVVDCSAMPGNLLESELFGHEKGAFTGADSRRTGAFEQADGGTVFIDEVGELPMDLQPKLLRVLESREVRRVGSNQHQPVDIRIIAATNRDLRGWVNEGRFRADLYYRLSVVRAQIPPLRERPEDIPLLVRHMMDSMSSDPGTVAKMTDSDLIARLQQFAWPGNVRELRNYLEGCVVLEQFPDLGTELPEAADEQEPSVDIRIPFSVARRQALQRFERAYITKILRAHGDNVSRAARAAGIDRVYFHRILARCGIR